MMAVTSFMNDPSLAWPQVAHDIGIKSNSRHSLTRPGWALAESVGNPAGKPKVNSCCNAKSAGTIQTVAPLSIDSAGFSSARGRKPGTKRAGSAKRGSAA
jgi:hypothetical protein